MKKVEVNLKMKIINGVQSNHVWMIKNNNYLTYVRIIGNIFILMKKHPAYEN
jgi:hypothetical protein